MGPGSPCVPIPRLGLICHKPWGGRQNTPRGRGSERGPACFPVLTRLGPAGQAPTSGSNGSTWVLPLCRDRVLGTAGPAQGVRSRDTACAALLGAHGRAGQQLGLRGPESVCFRASQLGCPPHADPGLAGVWGADFRALVPSLLSLVGSCRRFPPAPGPWLWPALRPASSRHLRSGSGRHRLSLESWRPSASGSQLRIRPASQGHSALVTVTGRPGPTPGGRRAAVGSSRGQVTVVLLGRFFIGTSVSTFSFRIHEEREILGLDPRTTYNRFCGDQEEQCEQPTHWKVAY